jgi:Zn-dependent peptidase ImmA (M78 family)
MVKKLLSEHQIGEAPVDVLSLAKKLGLEIKKEPTEANLSGFLFRNEEQKTAIIGVNSNQHPNRQRFTIAHELAHYLLHSTGSVHVDRGYSVKLRDEKSSEGTDEEEKEANFFAAELLMPENILTNDIVHSTNLDLFDENTLNQLANRYKVSTQALAFRLAYLGFS